MKIALIISQLAFGGAERVVCLLANHWSSLSHQILLVTFSPDIHSVYPINSAVQIYSAQTNSRRQSNNPFSKILSFRRLIRKLSPDVIISFCDTTNIQVSISLLNIKIPLIFSERNHPAYKKIPLFYSLFRRLAYNRSSALVVQTNEIEEWFHFRRYRVPRFIIANPILPNDDRESSGGVILLPENSLIAMGSLTKKKGYDRMLAVFEAVHTQFPEWTLFIIGEGPLRPWIEQKLTESKLHGSVKLLGFQGNPVPILKQASIFLFTSYYEGFPNALAEAMAASLPVVSFDCPSGPSDMIRDGENGFLIPQNNITSFVDKLSLLIQNPELRQKMSFSASLISSRYDIKAISSQWIDLIRTTLSADTNSQE